MVSWLVTASQSPMDTLMPSERLGSQRCQNVHKHRKPVGVKVCISVNFFFYTEYLL